ncbi:hypothetical protein KR018_008796 [Drosophila ironensis]|nr:hypothetical protein KR018_008796 [Drosophila ironensis]
MLPTWLTEDYIQTALQAFYKDDQLRVLKVCSKPATGKGENYVGVMTRIFVKLERKDGTVQQESYILKQVCGSEGPEADIFREYDVYTKEMDMYEIVLPKMAKILKEAGFTEKLMADAIIVDREKTIMILEDLAPLRYTNANRIKQLDIVHTKMVLEMLGKFHAASIVLNQREPNLLSSKTSSYFFSKGKKGYQEFFVGLFKAFIRYVKSQPELKKQYGAKLDRLIPNVMEYGSRCIEVGEEDLQTLIHGDCWTTNVMYRYDDEGNPSTVLPIDFQFSSWTSPVVDLHYLFSTSLKTEVFDREAELVQHHYCAMKETLEALSYKGRFPSLFEYQLQFERRRFMTVIFANTCQPFMVYEGTENPVFANLYQDTPEGIKIQDTMYTNLAVQNRIEKILPVLDAKGLLDSQYI